jgi:pre-mRNA-processing factor 6
MLSLKLDRAADSVTGQTVLDPKGYMTELKSIKINTDTEISDIKKARLLLRSVVQTNPKHGPGWIAAARLEEVAGRTQTARKIIGQGLDNCLTDEDVWLEAVMLQSQHNAKLLLAKGVTQLPKSIKLWIQAAQLEQETTAKSNILRKAIEKVPESVRLWKEAVDLACEEDARVLLSHAVECCPQHVELWLALTKLETYENARKILNKAREAIPTDPQIWFIASKLEEAHGNSKMTYKIIDRGLKSLMAHGVIIDRDAWLKEAETSEKNMPKMIGTCQAIVKAVVELGIEDQDKKRTWIADAEECLKRGSIETARSIYQHALTVFPTKKSIWWRAAMLEKVHGTMEQLDKLLKNAVKSCPKATSLWLIAAKEKWIAGDINGARLILAEAFRANEDSEDIWVAAFKLEFEENEIERARKLLEKARSQPKSSTPRIWMKSAIVERHANNPHAQRSILREGIKRYSNSWKLWIMLAQLDEKQYDIEAARKSFMTGLKLCPEATTLWINCALFEERLGNISKARSILEQGQMKNPCNEAIWHALIGLEIRMANEKTIEVMLAKALHDCPMSGLLWSQAILKATRCQRKMKCTDALKHCDGDPYVTCTIARLFWHDKKLNKARSWFKRALSLNPDVGDFWAYLFCFEQKHGTSEQQLEVIKMCQASEPRHGEIWCKVSKDPDQPMLKTEQILKKAANYVAKSNN